MADISVEVVAGDARKQILRRLRVPLGTTVGEAVARAALGVDYPGLRVDPACLGIFGRLVDPSQVLTEGDRVEVYRPLKVDPKEVRRQLAALSKRA